MTTVTFSQLFEMKKKKKKKNDSVGFSQTSIFRLTCGVSRLSVASLCELRSMILTGVDVSVWNKVGSTIALVAQKQTCGRLVGHRAEASSDVVLTTCGQPVGHKLSSVDTNGRWRLPVAQEQNL